MIERLLLQLLIEPLLNTGILLRGSLLPDSTIFRIPTQDIGIEEGDKDEGPADDPSQKPRETPNDGGQEQIKEKPPEGVEEEAEIDGNLDTNERELGFQTANQQTAACGVDTQDKFRNRGKTDQHDNRDSHSGNGHTHIHHTHQQDNGRKLFIIQAFGLQLGSCLDLSDEFVVVVAAGAVAVGAGSDASASSPPFIHEG
eukprot:CAMPEP_0202462878 /NCGR_PEP_ID=MMETSP1360-20130828/55858_1 /ASSEMBLY_ACC=CAM_ASM_000848 /TAXON_ID=515479 /ORGANISM="Licmophora paradoxa, Strain CCMP2313" /LENGTH=198 /DNA_ID=CAMNT_0049085531 /DNA_START=197 /DNA_END=791 /DNA_ORIENTATION=+